MNTNRGCIECETLFISEDYICPECNSERVISVEEAFYVSLDFYKKQLIKNPEDLELLREEFEFQRIK